MRGEAQKKRVVTKSIRLTAAEVEEWAAFTELTGATEATAMKRALQRGLHAERLDQGFLAMHQGASTAEAAKIAGLPRAVFIEECLDHRVPIDGPDEDWREALERGARALGVTLPDQDGDGPSG
ncbi:MAG: hypothetical protein ACYDAC_11980 [Candidatus Dormibacteria bacterium]